MTTRNNMVTTSLLMTACAATLSGAGGASDCDEQFLNELGGMTAYWTFDNQDDPIADDYGAYDGFNNGATWVHNGVVDGSLKFDGVNDHADITNEGLNVPIWDTYTFAVWFLNDGGGDLTNGYGQKILDKTTWFSDFYLSVHTHSDGHLVFFTYDDGSAAMLDLDYDYGDSQWHHAVVVKSGQYGELWVDGDLKDTSDELKSPNNGQPLLLGYSISGDSFQRKHWSGRLDEFAIFDRTLSEAEIQQLYASTLDGHHYCAVSPAEDLNGDGVVDSGDLVILLASWGPCADCKDCPPDFDNDCNVGTADLLTLLGNWG